MLTIAPEQVGARRAVLAGETPVARRGEARRDHVGGARDERLAEAVDRVGVEQRQRREADVVGPIDRNSLLITPHQ
jgi:glycerol-3-phosphate O-acyltransferase